MLRILHSSTKGLRSCALVVSLYGPGALAQLPPATDPPAQAESDASRVTGRSLFEQGKALYEADNLEEACVKFAESHRIAPTTVALLGLATCHRARGKLGTAWSEYLEIRARAQREAKSELEAHAESAMRELQPRLSTLLIEVSPQVAKVPGLSVRVDGSPVAPEAWNRLRAYDGGQHTVEASATGRDSWRTSLTLRQEADDVRVQIPVLERAQLEVSQQVQSHASSAVVPGQAREISNPWGALEWLGVGSVGVGLATFITSWQLRYTGPAETASEQDRRKNQVARNLLGVSYAAGGLGVTLFIIGRSSGDGPPSPRVALSLQAPTDGTLGANLYGTF